MKKTLLYSLIGLMSLALALCDTYASEIGLTSLPIDRAAYVSAKKKRKAPSQKGSLKPKAARAECCYCHVAYKIGPDLTDHQRKCTINKIPCRFCPMRCRIGTAITKHEEICAIKKGIDLQLLVPEVTDNPEEDYLINFDEPFHFYIPVETFELPVPPTVPPTLDALNESLSIPDNFNGE